MRRTFVPLSVVVVVLLGVLFVGRSPLGAGAHDATPAAPAAHPAVGVWLVTNPDFADDPPFLYAVHADGTVVGSSIFPGESVSYGAWEPTGPRAAAFTLVRLVTDPVRGYAGTLTFRGTAEVDATGDRFVGTNTVQFTARDGTAFPAEGPVRVEGRRIRVEPMTPPGTPEAATPAA